MKEVGGGGSTRVVVLFVPVYAATLLLLLLLLLMMAPEELVKDIELCGNERDECGKEEQQRDRYARRHV